MIFSSLFTLYLSVLLAAVVALHAAEQAGQKFPDYYQLHAKWKNRPRAETLADAERGDANAQCYLGRLMLDEKKDISKAIEWLRRSQATNPEAKMELARCNYLGLGMNRDLTSAVRLAREGADQGSASSKNLLGILCHEGAGIPQNDAEAVRLIREAAAEGNPTAMFNLGYFHESGQAGLRRDDSEMSRWYRQSAEAGHPGGMAAYGWCLLNGRGVARNREEAFRWLQRSAEQNSAHALRLIAEYGGTPAGDDPRAAYQAWRQSARLGNTEAMFRLARLIAAGETDPESDMESPTRLLQAAAEGGHVEAALALGDRYRRGYAVPRDLVAAARWFWFAHLKADGFPYTSTTSQDPAAPAGLRNWFDDAGRIKFRRAPEDMALAEALRLYLRAAQQRDPEAMREIAHWYQQGRFVPVILIEARAWLQLAVQSGASAAKTELKAIETQLSPEQMNESRDRLGKLIVLPTNPPR